MAIHDRLICGLIPLKEFWLCTREMNIPKLIEELRETAAQIGTSNSEIMIRLGVIETKLIEARRDHLKTTEKLDRIIRELSKGGQESAPAESIGSYSYNLNETKLPPNPYTQIPKRSPG